MQLTHASINCRGSFKCGLADGADRTLQCGKKGKTRTFNYEVILGANPDACKRNESGFLVDQLAIHAVFIDNFQTRRHAQMPSCELLAQQAWTAIRAACVKDGLMLTSLSVTISGSQFASITFSSCE